MNVVMNSLAKEGYEFAGLGVPELGTTLGDLVLMIRAERR
jgi:hypothetical protein